MAGVYWGRRRASLCRSLDGRRRPSGEPEPPYSRGVDGIFSPPADRWIKLSPKYAVVRVVGAIIANALFWVPVSLLWAWVFEPRGGATVSYTHLTLPTKRIV